MSLRIRLSAPFLLLLFLTPSAAADGKPEPVPLDAWLQLGPTASPLPAFHDDRAGRYSSKDLLESRQLPDGVPRATAAVPWGSGGELSWAPVRARKDGRILLGKKSSAPGTAWLATFLHVPRFSEVTLTVRSHHLLRVDVDGETEARRKACTGAEDDSDDELEPGKATAELQLEAGVHRILIKAVREPECEHPWAVSAEVAASIEGVTLSAELIPERPLQLSDVLDAQRPSAVALSPDGELVAITLQRILPGTDDSERWIEVRHMQDGRLERTYRGGSMSSVGWAPTGRRLTYVTRSDGKGTLWLADLEAGSVTALIERVEGLGGHRWARDGASVLYSVREEADENDNGIQRLLGLRDRQAGARDRSFLYQLAVPGGGHRRLTAGELTTSAGGLSPDGRRLLFTRAVDDYDARPYIRRELFVLDLETLEPELIYRGDFFGSATWSPDGERLLVVAGPSAFGGAGRAVPEGTIANDYDEQLYVMDADGGNVRPLSLEFDPSINSAVWHHGDGNIYLNVTEGPRRRLYRFDPSSGSYRALETGADVLNDVDIARVAPVAAYIASSAAQPPRVHALDLSGGEPRVLHFPGEETFRDVLIGAVKSWSFVSRRGATIEGRVHYPPDFDASRRYPAIVYYYGGTSPTSREFGGRYPKNWWSANGYVVYVLQPSGTIGYGQEYSALHVNDWGAITGEDILEGVDAFLEAHPFVDRSRLGCIGASYGGFMTQYLLTRTDRFAAGISHAGISSLGSYWGEGYWGYAYSGVATAGSFPWNRGEIYVGHSPLFNADRIHTPLLLLHGTQDTNVPPGESEQLYTALKLLGREVEYVRIEGQDHHILKHDQRVIWSKTIVAFFDRWLKGEPEWWEHLYPEPGVDAE